MELLNHVFDLISAFDKSTAWLRITCFAVIAVVIFWRWATDVAWPWFRAGLAVAFSVSTLGGIAVALDNQVALSLIRSLQTPLTLWLALTSIYYMYVTHKAARAKRKIDAPNRQAEGYNPDH